jgi:hypothetical protein
MLASSPRFKGPRYADALRAARSADAGAKARGHGSEQNTVPSTIQPCSSIAPISLWLVR